MEGEVKLLQPLGLLDSVTPTMSHIGSFHDLAMVVVIFIISVVLYVMLFSMVSKGVSRSMKSNESLETVWTVLPCIVLAVLAAPSLVTLYMSEESGDPFMCLKVIGHQWYWTYEYGTTSFDSYMVPTMDLESSGFRLLECDARASVPMGVEVRMIITSGDVIHSWALPSAGVKMDAIPGRLNQINLCCTRPGVLYGQCSEICGSFHSFMPINVEVVPLDEFFSSYFPPMK